jgi:hypothetical protein
VHHLPHVNITSYATSFGEGGSAKSALNETLTFKKPEMWQNVWCGQFILCNKCLLLITSMQVDDDYAGSLRPMHAQSSH